VANGRWQIVQTVQDSRRLSPTRFAPPDAAAKQQNWRRAYIASALAMRTVQLLWTCLYCRRLSPTENVKIELFRKSRLTGGNIYVPQFIPLDAATRHFCHHEAPEGTLILLKCWQWNAIRRCDCACTGLSVCACNRLLLIHHQGFTYFNTTLSTLIYFIKRSDKKRRSQ